MKITKLKKIISGAVILAIVIASGVISSQYFRKNRSASVIQPDAVSGTDSHIESQTVSSPAVDETLPTEETVTKKYVRVLTGTYLRAKDTANSDQLAFLEAGYEGMLLDETEKYYHISGKDDKTGWVLIEKCEIFQKDLIVRHIPRKPSDTPFSMADTAEGERLAQILKKNGTVGASVAIIKEGKVAYHYEYGYANKEDKKNPIPINENTKYRIASISKVFTSMLAMAEVEDGQMNLDAKLSDLFGYEFYNPKYPNIPLTMRMLLTHTAGLTTQEGQYSEPLYSVSRGEKYYSSKPGTKYAYSNLSMGIAGAAVEKAADKSLSQYARERFFEPMGIDASYDGSLLSDKSLVADCYNNGRLKRTNAVLTRRIGNNKTKPGDIYYLGQGNLMISAIDLAKVSTILLNDGTYEGKQYLRSETVRQMLTVHPVNTRTKYEQCIGIRKYAGLVENRVMYYHTGTYYGILALMAIDPSDKSGVIVITSGAHPPRDDNTVFRVCNDVMKYCYQEII